MKASVIITTFSRPVFLQRAVASVLNQQTKYDFEVIVIDDNGFGSEFQKFTQAQIQQDQRIRYFAMEKNSGACFARNKGSELAKGEYLLFLDDDDEFLAHKIEQQISFLDKNIEYDGCLAGFIRVDENGAEIRAESNYPSAGSFKEFVLHGNFFTPMLCIRKTSFNATGGFTDIPRFQDRFFLMKALQKGGAFAVIRDQLHIMHEHKEGRITSTSINKTKMSLIQISDWLKIYKQEFSKKEWNVIEINDLKKMAVSHYNSSDKKDRMKASYFYLKLYLRTFVFKYFIMAVKSLVKQ